ncbi:hypothetical protein [Cytobacillus sp. NCCP-133]|uniref:hypothetical protein n=1 Tax=Cytobacillus sp. NCCP-133 TaxID=766848 RepID=UPI0022323C52|nr:hypothetical protein [Cytobacillus sp. NCCP-133]GLB60216.1 hypothetical protein NCCP133_23480 [Cytobacillus sp. NCCP-133]
MYYRIRLLKGVLFPRYLSYQLKESEAMIGLLPRLVLLFIASSCIFALGSLSGIGTETLSRELTASLAHEFELKKLLFAIGQVVWGLVYASLFIFLPALFFWTLTEIEYKKLLIIQAYSFLILVCGKAVNMVVSFLLSVDPIYSPFSFGALFQYLTVNEWIIAAFGTITLFHLWAIFIQYYYLNELTEKNSRFIFWIVLALNIFFWIVNTLLSYIKIENLV